MFVCMLLIEFVLLYVIVLKLSHNCCPFLVGGGRFRGRGKQQGQGCCSWQAAVANVLKIYVAQAVRRRKDKTKGDATAAAAAAEGAGLQLVGGLGGSGVSKRRLVNMTCWGPSLGPCAASGFHNTQQ